MLNLSLAVQPLHFIICLGALEADFEIPITRGLHLDPALPLFPERLNLNPWLYFKRIYPGACTRIQERLHKSSPKGGKQPPAG